jgi:hypothetical protein
MSKTLWRSGKIALVIGTILFFINHYQLLFGAELKDYEIIQIALTYLVPFCVSFYSARCEALDSIKAKNSI